MPPTSRRPRPIDRDIPHRRDTRLVIVATEGRYAEPRYFALFQRLSSRVQVKVLETPDGRSSPAHVLARLRHYRREYQLDAEDQLWLVIDKDRWTDAHLSDVSGQAHRMRLRLAVSRPCFEVWLYVHHADAPLAMAGMTGQQVKDALRALLGEYNDRTLHAERFAPHVDEAIRRARALDTSPADRWPSSLGTRIYRVVEAIRELAE